MNTKSEAREFCLQFLYHFQLPVFSELKKNLETADLFERIQEFKVTLGKDLGSEGQAYVAATTRGILSHHEALDEVLTKYLKNWKLSRISKIEHTIFMLAIYELTHTPEIPAKVVINEAIELGKKYSTKESSSFINGILDSIMKQELGRNE